MELLSTIGQFALSALVFLIIFGLLIIVHELGHFWMARRAKIKVEEFGLGLPPKVWGKETSREIELEDSKGKKQKIKDNMVWSLNAIPFGGFVRMRGEDGGEKYADDPMAFSNRPLLWRMGVTLGGVTMNFLLAFVLFMFLGWTGSQAIIDPNFKDVPRFETYFADGHVEEYVEQGFYTKQENGAFVLMVAPDSPAEKIGLEAGDQIISINDTEITSSKEVSQFQEQVIGTEMGTYTIRRFYPQDNYENTFTVNIAPQIQEGKKVIGILLVDQFYYPLEDIQFSFLQAPVEAFKSSKRLVILSVDMVQGILASTLGNIAQLQTPEIPQDVGGPVAIAGATKQLVELGDIDKIIQFTAVLSLSLAVINLVPFPALDGGRLFFQILEGIFFLLLWPFKKLFPKANITHRLPAKWETPFHLAGYALLLLFIVIVTFKDIGRMFAA